MTYRIDVLKRTQDDWHGSYRLLGWYKGEQNPMFVHVTYHHNISPAGEPPCYRISVWGNDDCGRDYDCQSEQEALTIFMQVIGLEFVNFKDLQQLGFKPA